MSECFDWDKIPAAHTKMMNNEHVYNECTDVNSDYVLDVLDIILIINIILDA